jgi:osmotically-inducible protein OsmY
MRIALLLLLAVAVGCGGPRRSEDPKVRDQEITRDILWELQREERFADIRVTCKDGIVSLDGMVTDESDHDQAKSLARRISGVKDVRSRLRIRSR